MKIKIYILIIFLSVTSFSQTIVKKVYTDKTLYSYGDTVFITIRVISTSLVQDTITFPDACEAYPFIDNINYLMTFGIGCAQIVTPRIIPPEDSVEWIYQHPVSSPLLSTGQHSVFGHFVELIWDPFTVVNSNTDTIIFFVEEPSGIVKEQKNNIFVLERNYPNPFNPRTKIEYKILKGSEIRFNVINILGETVFEKNLGYQLPGNYKIDFDGNGLSSGVYLYLIIADENRLSCKMVLMK